MTLNCKRYLQVYNLGGSSLILTKSSWDRGLCEQQALLFKILILYLIENYIYEDNLQSTYINSFALSIGLKKKIQTESLK